MRRHIEQHGFTIVEVLVVIVVISILASITVVAYNGIQNRAYDSALDSQVSVYKKALALYRAQYGTYPTNNSTGLEDRLYSAPSGTNIASKLLPFVSPLPIPQGESASTPQASQSFRYIHYPDTGSGEMFAFTVVYRAKTPCKVVYGAIPANYFESKPTCT